MALTQRPMSDDEHDHSYDMAMELGPAQADQTVRQALMCCWMTLPKSRRTVDEVEKELRRLVDRALRDFREDSERFSARE